METSTFVAAVAVGLVFAVIALVVLRERKRQRADRRAEQLLREILTPAELSQLNTRGHLDVPSRTWPGRVYRIPEDPGMVAVMESGVPVVRLCLLPARDVPEREHIIIHKLLLEGAEAEYWERANHFTGGLRGGLGSLSYGGGAQVEVWTGSAPGVIGQR
jgi:hypothetical protein